MALTISQKILLGSLYSLIALMIVFSVMAAKNVGLDGFKKCMNKEVIIYGEEIYSNYKHVNNCCLGAGGKTAQSSSGYSCVFE